MSVDKQKLLELIDKTELEKVGLRKGVVPGWVYFIVTIDAPNCKIGYTQTVGGISKRLRSLQTGSPNELAIMAAHPGTPDTERRLHERFAASRLRGEWFEITDEIRAYMVVTVWAMLELSLIKGWQPAQWMTEATRAIFETLGVLPNRLAEILEVAE